MLLAGMSLHLLKLRFKISIKSSITNDENIDNYGYIDTSILRMYRKHWRNIGGAKII